jgi:hypothetical protein
VHTHAHAHTDTHTLGSCGTYPLAATLLLAQQDFNARGQKHPSTPVHHSHLQQSCFLRSKTLTYVKTVTQAHPCYKPTCTCTASHAARPNTCKQIDTSTPTCSDTASRVATFRASWAVRRPLCAAPTSDCIYLFQQERRLARVMLGASFEHTGPCWLTQAAPTSNCTNIFKSACKPG